jgi:hypothetical protein
VDLEREGFERDWREQIARGIEEVFAAHGIVAAEPDQSFYYSGPPGPQPTLAEVAALIDIPQTEREWDGFLRSIGAGS